MGDKISENRSLNRLQEILDEKDLSSRVLGLCLNIHKGTLTNWTNNITQPSLDKIESIADLLEIDNHKFLVNSKRINTGKVKAFVQEYKRLTGEEEMDLYVQVSDGNGKTKKIYNPALQERMWQFINDYNENNSSPSHTTNRFIDKYHKDITEAERNGSTIFICKALPQDGAPYFQYMVVDESREENKFVARFNTLDDAQDYVDYMEEF